MLEVATCWGEEAGLRATHSHVLGTGVSLYHKSEGQREALESKLEIVHIMMLLTTSCSCI